MMVQSKGKRSKLLPNLFFNPIRIAQFANHPKPVLKTKIFRKVQKEHPPTYNHAKT
jgi:hypothetical protein